MGNQEGGSSGVLTDSAALPSAATSSEVTAGSSQQDNTETPAKSQAGLSLNRKSFNPECWAGVTQLLHALHLQEPRY
jgi:hypothetical protein